MILFGCLLAFGAAVAPRIILILAWLFSDRWQVVWQDNWVLPLLGIIFLPYTTIMYLLSWTLMGGIEGWDWLWIILGLLLDFMKWGQMLANRKEAAKQTANYYPSSAPGSGSMAAATAAPAVAAPAEVEAPAETAAPAAPVEAPAPEPAEPAEAVAEPDTDPTADPEVAKLDELKASGALTDEEYEAAKAKLQG